MTDHEALDLDALNRYCQEVRARTYTGIELDALADEVPALIAEVRRLRERIYLIAAEAKQQQRDADVALLLACRTCGKPHERREITRYLPGEPPSPGVSWADPDDGHSYFRKIGSDAAEILAAAPLIGEDKSHD